MTCGVIACSAGGGGGGGEADDVDVPAGGASSLPVGPGSPAPGAPGGGPLGEAPAPGASNEGNVNPGGFTSGSSGSSAVPCDIATIVSEPCTTCHAATPRFNAPMALTSAEAFNAPAPSTSSEAVRSVARRRINAEGAGRMPPPGTVEAL